MNNTNNVIDADDAYYLAYRAYDSENRTLPEEYDYLAEVILNDPNFKNTGIVVWWAKYVKTHVDEMFNKLLDYYDVYSAAEWYINVNYYKNKEIKIKVIDNGDVDEWINHINNDNLSLYIKKPYTANDFYADLPQEYQLGILIRFINNSIVLSSYYS